MRATEADGVAGCLHLIETVVYDDKSAVELPSTHTSATQVLNRVTVSVNGQADLVSETANIFVVDSSAPSKSTNHVINECALNILARGTGARVLFMLSDMGPLNYNLALTVLFSIFPTNIGMYDMVLTAFFLRLHSKQICDRM